MGLYVVEIKQKGEGCDHTIECGTKVLHLKADSIDEAKDSFKTMLEEGELLSCDLEEIEYATIYEAPNVFQVNVDAIVNNLKLKKHLAKEDSVMKNELAELKRLKLKYEAKHGAKR
jgi:hypothetical protein